MQLTQKSLDKYKKLYLKIFGEVISDEEVGRKATYLLEIFRVVYGMSIAGETSVAVRYGEKDY